MFNKIALCLFLFIFSASVFAFDAPNTAPLYRFVDDSGTEMYLANPAKVAAFKKAKPNGIKQIVGYVYLEKTSDTVPLLGMTKQGEFGLQFFYTTNFDEGLKKQNQGWELIQENKGVICYVRKANLAGKTIGAWRFTQTNVKNSVPRWRFGFKEYEQWKNLKGVKFDAQAGFYVWQNPIATNNEVSFDLRLQPKIYLIGGEKKPFTDKFSYVIPSNPINLTKADATGCRTDRCSFYFAVTVIRTNKDAKITVPIRIGNKAETKIIYATFPNGETTQNIVFYANISLGNSVLSVGVDADGKFAEADETNNSISWNVMVK